jgi:hypothetical protein
MILSHESMRTMILRNVDGIYLKFSSANIPSEAMINTCLSFFSSGFPFFFLDEMSGFLVNMEPKKLCVLQFFSA